jgi:LCP family protein required for cell wall assembly
MKAKLLTLTAVGVAAALLWTSVGSIRIATAQEGKIVVQKAHKGSFGPSFSKPIFILTLGGDARSGNPDHVRTDSIHIVAIDPVNMKASILGIPRDSYVDIPGRGKHKINEAAYDGGPQLAVQTVENLSGCTFDYSTLTSFEDFRRLVDEFGGITLDVPRSMHETCCSRVNLNKGVQHVEGDQALAFARDRHTVPRGDFDRSLDQGLLMIAALAEARKDYTGDPGTALRNLAVLRRHLILNIPLTESIKLGLLALRLKPENVTNQVLDGANGKAGAASIVQITQTGKNQLVDICSDGQLGS